MDRRSIKGLSKSQYKIEPEMEGHAYKQYWKHPHTNLFVDDNAFKTEGQSLRIAFSKGGWFLRGVFIQRNSPSGLCFNRRDSPSGMRFIQRDSPSGVCFIRRDSPSV